MKNRFFLLFLLAALIIGLNACCASFKLSSELKKLDAPAVIVVTPDGEFITLTVDGKEAERCSIPEKGKKPEYEICPAFREGAKVINEQTIKVIKSEGSICWTYYDRNHVAHMICIP